MRRVGRRLLVPAASTLVMLSVLISLGTWQLHRLSWKRGLLAAIDKAEAAPAVPLPPSPVQFEKVHVEGRFRPDASALYGAQVEDTKQGPVLGAQLLMPLLRNGAPAILVDRGWVPEGNHGDPPAGDVSVSGYIRLPEHPGTFSAANDIPGRHFYTLDPAAIGQAIGLPELAPFTLVVLGEASELPRPAQHLPRPPNDHLSYAVTWFGLAAVLGVVFTLYATKKV